MRGTRVAIWNIGTLTENMMALVDVMRRKIDTTSLQDAK